MNILLEKPELEKFVNEKVHSGSFGSAEEVIEAGLARLMLDPPPFPPPSLSPSSISLELDAEDLEALAESERQIEEGHDLDWKEVSAQLRAKYLNG